LPLGDYQIIREIGRGGMGVVYEAIQLSLGRRVALKVLPLAGALDARQLQRFKNEAHAAAHLQHQNIVPVYFVGCERGVHFYAMQFVEGQTLAAIIQELRQLDGRQVKAPQEVEARPLGDLASELVSGRWAPAKGDGADSPTTGPYSLPPFVAPYQPGVGLGQIPIVETATRAVATISTEHSTKSPGFFRTVANLGIQAAEALEHAHQLGVIHRDIKPANLMVDARGNLWITDFGLAHCQGGCELTMSGDLLGTLRYMSPEQAMGSRVIVDQRTDIYSLGATLYELLALEPVFSGHDRQELLRQLAFEEPKPPHSLNKAIPPELETIVLKAVEKNPADRYATAQEFVDDLRRYLEDKPIRARRPTVGQRARKWVRRHPGVARTAVAALVVIALGSILSTMLIAHQRDLADARAREADDNAAEAIGRLYISDMRLAQRAWEDNQMGWLLELLEGQRPQRTRGIDLRGFEWHYWWRLSHSDLLTIRGRPISCVASTPDGTRIVSGGGGGNQPFELEVGDVNTGPEPFRVTRDSGGINCVAYSPDGKQIVSGNYDSTLRVWDAATGQETLVLKAPGWVMSVAFSPDGRRIVSGGTEDAHDARPRVWDATTGKEALTLKGHHTGMVHPAGVRCVAYSSNGNWIASGGEDNTVKVWDAATGEEIQTLKGHTGTVTCVTISPDGLRIVSGSGDNTLKVWDAATGQEILTLKGHTSETVTSVAFGPDGKRIVSGSWDNTVNVWDADSGQEILTLKGHTGPVVSVAYSPDGKRIVSGSYDTTLKIWDAATGQEPLTLKGHMRAATSVAFRPDGRRIVSGSDDNTLKVWDATTGHLVLSLKGHLGPVVSVAFSPEGKRIISGSFDNTLKVWNAETGEEILTLRGHTSKVMSLAFSPDGKRIVSGGGGTLWPCELIIWDAATGLAALTLKGPGVISTVAYSPDSKRIVVVWNETIKVWDAATGQESFTLQDTSGSCNVAFSPDGKSFAGGGSYHHNNLKVWDAATGQKILTLKVHTSMVLSVAYSRDGKRIVSGSNDNTLKVWDAASGQEILTLKGHTGQVKSVAFSPDGKRIVSGSWDNTIKVWDATPKEEKPLLAADPNKE
jgi:WD40 repeat protein/serine/threonine protein kinase